ncbi:MAG: ROK family protein [Cyanobacteriota bacterium]
MTKNIALGVDIGGTKISAACVDTADGKGKIISEVRKFATPDKSENIVGEVIKLIESFKRDSVFSSVGIATAGVVNIETGQVTSATENLASGYSGTNYKQLIKEKFNLPCFVDNDANAAAYAEHKYGAAKGYKNALVITFGTGIGSGIIIDNKIYRGNGFAAGECGHFSIDVNSERECTCGKKGCWETYATGSGFLKSFKEMVRLKSRELALVYPDLVKNVESYTVEDVMDRVTDKDIFCANAYAEWHYHIAVGLIALMNILAPECIVIGGGWSYIINAEYLQTLTNEKSPAEVKIFNASLGNDAGIFGAAAMSIEECKK